MHNSSIKSDVLGFAEIRLDSHMCSLNEIPGYHMFTGFRNVHGGEVALYISMDYDTTTQHIVNLTLITGKFPNKLKKQKSFPYFDQVIEVIFITTDPFLYFLPSAECLKKYSPSD